MNRYLFLRKTLFSIKYSALLAKIVGITISFSAYGATINITDNNNFYNAVFGSGDTLNFHGNANFYPNTGQTAKILMGSLILQSQNGNSIINLSNGSISGAFSAYSGNLNVTANNGITFSGGNRSLGSVFNSSGRNLIFNGNDTLTFDNNRASNGLAGSVIYISGSAVLAFNSPTTIISNNIGRGSGGAIWVDEPVHMSVTGHLSLINNIGNVNGTATTSSGGYGGALRIGQDIITGSTITTYAFDATGNKLITLTNNVAGMGGGGINTSGSIRIDGTVIAEGNKALGESGGALRAVDFNTSGVDLINPLATHEFKNNKAGGTATSATTGRGGAIVSKREVFIAGSATFEGNTARNGGGAIAAISGTNLATTGKVTLGNTNARLIFQSNKAGYSTSGTINTLGVGGAIHAPNNISIEGSILKFIENVATLSGGALYSNQKIILKGGLNAEKNYALSGSGFGGLLYTRELELTATADTAITSNMTGGTGGAIYLALPNGNNSIYAQGGDIVFSGNRSGVAFAGGMPVVGTGTANALYVNSALLDLKADADKTISFLDPITGSLGSASTIRINEGGETGTIQFSGENYLAGSNDTKSSILANTTVYSGTLDLKNNADYGANGIGSQFNLHTQAFLTTTATQGGTKNIINADDIDLSGTTQFRGSETQHFILNGTVNNQGLIVVANHGPSNILEITGDYIGAGGFITLNTQLGNESSPTDLGFCRIKNLKYSFRATVKN